ncbi:hypothetical protein GGI05_003521, partial [Coemansia sp. RSA 2603]
SLYLHLVASLLPILMRHPLTMLPTSSSAAQVERISISLADARKTKLKAVLMSTRDQLLAVHSAICRKNSLRHPLNQPRLRQVLLLPQSLLRDVAQPT